MLDFLIISTRSSKRNVVEIYPKFVMKKSSDLMIRGGDFYAIWIEDKGLWSTDEQDALRLIDNALDEFFEANKEKFDCEVRVLHMWDADSGMIDKWHKYCQKQMRDSYHTLDEKLIFSSDETKKEDYASKKLPYPLTKGEMPSYEKLVSTLYSPEERNKLEWAIGAVISGDSKKIQKFVVLYGSGGTGKSTMLHIMEQLFEGYYETFDSKALGSSSNMFALEAFKSNPLVAIEHDGDLSRIDDNTRLNSLVSHETMRVNEKFKSTYSARFNAFLFLGTNKPVKITDAKSGLIRRLIDVSPSGNKLSVSEYRKTFKQVSFELGAIAYHCLQVYEKDPGKYDDYIPVIMLGATNDFYNYIMEYYHVFKKEDGVSEKSAWTMYKTYCEEANVKFMLSRRDFKTELRSYFWDFKTRATLDDGTRPRNYYSGFRADIFEETDENNETVEHYPNIVLDQTKSIFDDYCCECLAQYATKKETPSKKWDTVNTKLSDLDTAKVHYVKLPENHIVIDFDIPDENGEKNLASNIREASKWPPTYAEFSKSGAGVHLHYIYTGDVSKLSRVVDDYIEVKVFTGNSSLRRKLTKCNSLPIATISSGLPLKGDKMINYEAVKNEKGIRSLIKRNLNKESHPGTKPSIDFIFKILDDAYKGGVQYDVSDMENAVTAFAAQSTHHADYCLKLVNKMHFKSDETSPPTNNKDGPIVFYDVEVFPNLFLVNWKKEGRDNPVVRMINPKPHEIEELLSLKLVGFNCRRYDNHILYARMIGYDNLQLFELSQKIVNAKKNANKNCYFGEAYNISYTDVYDFASAGKKKSLKKFEIELGIHHKELGLPWDQPVPEERWDEVAEYCDNDVIATEAVFNHLSGDWTARQILADLANMTVNDTTNTLTTKIIFGDNKKPQTAFNYRDLAEPVHTLGSSEINFLKKSAPEMMKDKHGENSLLPYFPGYKHDAGKSTYLGDEVGEGGYVYAEPGMYGNVALLDVSSMHPHSVIVEVLFGAKYTEIFKTIVDARVSIKHEDWDAVEHVLDGKLKPYIKRVKDGEMTSKELANALKTAINSVYGLTAASFENAFHDIRNIDNIVAKRGALFMAQLKHEVQKKGFTVAHIKTDSIKIPDATPGIIKFVMEFGKKYGYTFEHEATYERMCLVNDAVYIAKYADSDACERMYDYIPGDNKKHANEWTATGKQFAVPYVFKKLFSKEEIVFDDMCETFAVSKGDIYLDTNENYPDVSKYEDELKKLESKHKKGTISDDVFTEESERLSSEIKKGHNLHFVGRVGRFTPIKKGENAGVLYRVSEGKNYAVSGTTGYRWLESEMVAELKKENVIDKSYYNNLVDDAIEAISKQGDFEWFVSDEPYDGSTLQLDNTLPF